MHLMIANADGRVLNWGEPNWSNQDTLADYSILDVGEIELPPAPRNYRYVESAFVFDPLPPSEAELDKQAVMAAQVVQVLQDIAARQAQIDARRIVIPADVNALAAATTVQFKQIVGRMLQSEDNTLFAEKRELEVLDRVLRALRQLVS
jgi:hypothetical protein